MAKPVDRNGGDSPADMDDDEAFDANEPLPLAGGEERLPWLESDDDYEQPGVDTGRIVAFAAAGLLVLALILGGLWWFLGDRSDAELVADGSVIEAPDEPFRTRPENPGGREVEGTGATSFEVAEGEPVEGVIAGSGAPAPSIDREQAQGASDETSAATSGVGVQVGAYSTRQQAEAGWSQLAGRFEALQGRDHRILQGTADSGTVYRLQALASTVGEAETLCRTLRAAGGDCQVKR